jgi:DNA-binding CsgD family transcriptional regulator/tetratricopeptide (TPR) repeat protein
VLENTPVDDGRALEQGRGAYARADWRDAFDALGRAKREQLLSPDDFELLARSAYMLGFDDEYRHALEQAYHAYHHAADASRAARCAWWIGHNLMFLGQAAPARGWFARGRRLLEREDRDSVERGYLLIPTLLEHSGRGDFAAAYATAAAIAEIGERFGDDDLVALALMEQGHALVRQGKTEDGLRLVDETMVAVTAGELSPVVAGIVYCNTIAFCRDVYELRRAREWTEALTRWCEQQPDMVAHQGLCLVHRAEIMTLAGAWTDALEEARRVAEHFTRGVLNQRALGDAVYRQAEVYRLQGRFDEAEAAYREASRFGREPQPGFALMRLAQGKGAAAAAAMRRALSETELPLGRVALLSGSVEILVATGEVAAARAACDELVTIARRQGSEALAALAAQAVGAVALAEGDAGSALPLLRSAWQAWRELDAPYDAARARVLIARACAELGDEDTAALELDGARDTFFRLGARPDLARLEALAGKRGRGDHGLTVREVEVLRLIARGRSNREVAHALVISERTVARHVQNIFAKLRVSSRASASVFAAEHDLL